MLRIILLFIGLALLLGSVIYQIYDGIKLKYSKLEFNPIMENKKTENIIEDGYFNVSVENEDNNRKTIYIEKININRHFNIYLPNMTKEEIKKLADDIAKCIE